LCGVTNLFLLNEETHLLERHNNDILVGPLPQAAPLFRSRSPIYLAHKITDPLIIMHGEKDTAVPINQAEAIKAAVKGPVEYHVYKNEGHKFFVSAKVITDAYPAIANFLKMHVLYAK